MIKFENVNYIYKGLGENIHALHNVSLDIEENKITAIIGCTGSGKSTLVQLISGLEQPSSGKIFVGETEITDKKCNLRELRFRVGTVFQYPEQQLFEETVEADIAYGPKNMGLTEVQIRERVEYAAELAGLDKKLFKKSPFELSGGEKRRAAIAGVLAMQPQIMIFDEPSAGLDPEGRKAIFELIRKLKSDGKTVIFISHSMDDVAMTADNVVVLNRGRAVMCGDVNEVFSQGDELERAGLEQPQTLRLCESLRKVGFNLPYGIHSIEETAKYIRGELDA